MKKSKSGGTRIVMGVKFSRIIPRYWYSVGCLLTGLSFGLGFVGCVPTVNEQKGHGNSGKCSFYIRASGAKRRTKTGFGKTRYTANTVSSSTGSVRPRRIGTNDSPAKTHETYFSISPFSADSARTSRGGHVWRFRATSGCGKFPGRRQCREHGKLQLRRRLPAHDYRDGDVDSAFLHDYLRRGRNQGRLRLFRS